MALDTEVNEPTPMHWRWALRFFLEGSYARVDVRRVWRLIKEPAAVLFARVGGCFIAMVRPVHCIVYKAWVFQSRATTERPQIGAQSAFDTGAGIYDPVNWSDLKRSLLDSCRFKILSNGFTGK